MPRLLRHEEKQERVDASRKLIDRNEVEGKTFLRRIITSDEMWLWNFEPESKALSSVWKISNTLQLRRQMLRYPVEKKTFAFFEDRHGMILGYQVFDRQTANVQYYSEVSHFSLLIFVFFKSFLT